MNMQLQLDRESWIPLQDQLFEQLRQMIVRGTLKPNSRVVATRFLAEQIGVSRTTILLAYERLISEGYLETRPAIGTFVSARPPETTKRDSSYGADSNVSRQASLRPSIFNSAAFRPPKTPEGFINFSPQLYETERLLPEKLWLKGIRNVFESAEGALQIPPPPAGVEQLRRVIVDHLAVTRGLVVSPDQVIIVDGSHQACSFVAHLFQRRGDAVVLESPGDDHIATFFEARGAELVPVPVDENGIETDRLPNISACLAYVSPARQNPIGGTLPLRRREALIEWARKAGCYLIEDDSDGDLRYFGMPPPPLMTLDPYGLVFLVGSFSKTLGAGLGLGYLVVPPEFVDGILTIKTFAEGGRQWLEQMVIADLLAGGQYDHHLRRLRKQNLERRDCLLAELRTHFGDVRLIGTEVGSQLSWVLPDEFPIAKVLCEVARAHGVILKGVVDRFAAPQPANQFHDRTLLIGYANLPMARILQGIARLAEALTL